MIVKIYDNDDYYIKAVIYDVLSNDETEFELELLKGDRCIYHSYISGVDLKDAIESNDESFNYDAFDDVRTLHLTTSTFREFQAKMDKIVFKYNVLLAGLDRLIEEIDIENERYNQN